MSLSCEPNTRVENHSNTNLVLVVWRIWDVLGLCDGVICPVTVAVDPTLIGYNVELTILHSQGKRTQPHPTLHSLTVEQVYSFLTRASQVKRDILQPQPLTVQHNAAPDILPPSIVLFLSKSVLITPAGVQQLWDALKDVAWAFPTPTEQHVADEKAFETHGHEHGIGRLPASVSRFFDI